MCAFYVVYAKDKLDEILKIPRDSSSVWTVTSVRYIFHVRLRDRTTFVIQLHTDLLTVETSKRSRIRDIAREYYYNQRKAHFDIKKEFKKSGKTSSRIQKEPSYVATKSVALSGTLVSFFSVTFAKFFNIFTYKKHVLSVAKNP